MDICGDTQMNRKGYILEEKFRAGGIPADEWWVIYDRFKDFTPLWEGK